MAQAPKNMAGQIGFVGVGNMGAPMVRNLAKAGVRVRIFDLSAKALAPFGGVANVEIAKGLAEVGRGLSVVITIVADGKVVQKAALGDQGFAAAMAKGGIVVDMSSSYPLDTRELQQKLSGLGLKVVDAPVSGGVPRAITGTLAIMAGGEAGDVDAVEPVLSAMGKVLRTGPLSSGHAMKALNNYVSAAGLIATSEALLVGERFGLSPQTMVDVLNASTGRNNTTENKAARHLIPRTFNSGFTLALLLKDVGMANQLAKGLGVAAEDLEHATRLIEKALAVLGPAADHTSIIDYTERSGKT